MPTFVVAVTFAGAVCPVAVTPTVVMFWAPKAAVAREVAVSVEVPVAPGAMLRGEGGASVDAEKAARLESPTLIVNETAEQPAPESLFVTDTV